MTTDDVKPEDSIPAHSVDGELKKLAEKMSAEIEASVPTNQVFAAQLVRLQALLDAKEG